MIEAFSSLNVSISDGNTVPSVDILGCKTYVDIGSGTVLKLSWDTPVAENNKVDYYSLTITACESNLNTYYTLYDGSIGNVNEFYLNASLLAPVTTAQSTITFRLIAQSIYGSKYSGAATEIVAQVNKGCGTYIKIDNGIQPIMKRAIAFSKLQFKRLTDAEGKAIRTVDSKELYVKTSAAQSSSSGWTLMQEFSAKDSANNWKLSDIKYEVLTDADGAIITDINNEPIYVL